MDDGLDLPVPMPPELAEEFLKKLVYVSEGLTDCRIDAGTARVAFRLKPGFESTRDVVVARVLEVADKLTRFHRPGSSRVLASRTGPGRHEADPHAALEAAGELVEFGQGRYGLGPLMSALVESLDRAIVDMAAELTAPPYQFPSLIAADVLERCRYLKNFPASLNVVSHLREDLGLLQEFANSVACDVHGLRFNRDVLAPVECLLAPSVCFHWYNWLKDSTLAVPRTVTARGKCFRYESSSLSGLERLWDFTMREVIFVGPQEFVLEHRQWCVDQSVALLDTLGLTYEIATATDPFFVDSYAVQAAFQQGFELKYELLCPLPYSGKRLAVGSVNYHQDFFGRSFAIGTSTGTAHTGCIGFGLERLALAVVAQHGPSPALWPATLRDRVLKGAA